MSLPQRGLSKVAKESLVVAALATLTACGGESGSLFSASGVSGAGAASAGAAGRSNQNEHGGGSGAGGAPSVAGSGSQQMPADQAGTPNAGDRIARSVCDGKLKQPAALIADFEHGAMGWSSYIGNGGNTVFGGVQSTQPGAAQTQFAATFSGDKADISGMFHTQYCSDVSQFDGVSFWAKGQGNAQLRFLAVIPATDPTSGFGDCDSATSVCSDHPGLAFTVSDQWQAYHLAWRDLAQYGWGTPAQFAGVINALLWINDGPVGRFQLSLDQVMLYTGEPPL
jgi:hypothetical protein